MKKKIVLIGFTKICYMPYLYFYLNRVKKNEYEIHLIYWDRDKKEDVSLSNDVFLHSYKYEIEDTMPLYKKIPGILGFSKFAKKELEEINADKLIVMHSTTALTIYRYLKKKYYNKYIFDYRDVTYEKFIFYKMLISKIVKNSYITFISSNDFRMYLPTIKNKIYLSHNTDKFVLDKYYFNSMKKDNEIKYPIRIAFWGLIRHTDYNKKIIKKIGMDERYQLHYYGRATGEDLKLLLESEKKYNNIFFHGEYMPHEREVFAKNTDIIHNLYSNQDPTTPHAMGNKFYDGLIFKIPQLCTSGSYMGRVCTEYGVGMECNPDNEQFCDEIFDYYVSIDRSVFDKSCVELITKIKSEIEEGELKIDEFISK